MLDKHVRSLEAPPRNLAGLEGSAASVWVSDTAAPAEQRHVVMLCPIGVGVKVLSPRPLSVEQ